MYMPGWSYKVDPDEMADHPAWNLKTVWIAGKGRCKPACKQLRVILRCCPQPYLMSIISSYKWEGMKLPAGINHNIDLNTPSVITETQTQRQNLQHSIYMCYGSQKSLWCTQLSLTIMQHGRQRRHGNNIHIHIINSYFINAQYDLTKQANHRMCSFKFMQYAAKTQHKWMLVNTAGMLNAGWPLSSHCEIFWHLIELIRTLLLKWSQQHMHGWNKLMLS